LSAPGNIVRPSKNLTVNTPSNDDSRCRSKRSDVFLVFRGVHVWAFVPVPHEYVCDSMSASDPDGEEEQQAQQHQAEFGGYSNFTVYPCGRHGVDLHPFKSLEVGRGTAPTVVGP
jgi:hypothetical protein